MVDILVKALSLVAIIAVGQFLKRMGWASAADFPLLSRIVLGVTLPCALLTSFNDYHLDHALLGLVALGLAVTVVQQAIGYLLALRRGRREQAFAVVNSGSYNIGAFSTPYLSGIIGPHAMIYSTLFDIGGAVAAAGVGYGWGMTLASEPGTHRPRDLVRTLAGSPVFVTYIVLLVMRLADWRLPDQVIVFTATVGAANPFLAMFMIGIGLELRLHRSKLIAAARLLCLRYGFSIAVAIACWLLLPLPGEARMVVVMLLFAPIASMIPGFTARIGGDVELSAFAASISMLVAIVAMPTIYLVLR